MEVAIFSDLHLGVHNDSPLWHDITNKWIDSFISKLKQKKVNTIFFLGDWFHNRAAVSGLTLKISADILEKFKDFSLYMFPGNHDLYYLDQADVSSIALFKGYENITLIEKPTTIFIGNKTITMVPWGYSPVDSSVSSADYLFGHLEINTFAMNSSGQLCEDGFKLSELLSKFKLIFSGHFHKAQERKYSSGTIQYVGNPFQMNYGEAEDTKGFIILDINTSEYSFIENKISPKFIKWNLSDLIKKDYPTIAKNCRDNFVRLSIDLSITTEDMSELVKLISACKPEECDIDWDNSSFSGSISGSTDFVSLEFLNALTEYTKMLDIDNTEEIITYLTKKYKEAANE